ncbi:MAG: hypothetical protein CVU39_17175 [Chloroflexi bacterium HGW-Chloroflexi-10]|nr:MAG: hypothetical protein CVU39_17175 [Chloroflexi bacterium HGW-Chloroflexi-10]
MSILQFLSLQVGQRREQGNHYAAGLILEKPELMEQLLPGLIGKEAKLLADCAEVCTMVAEVQPALVAPHTAMLIPLAAHKNTRVRWEAMHALALVSALVPELLLPRWNQFSAIFREDQSVIVRDCIVLMAGNLAAIGADSAAIVLPLLTEALSAHQTHHAKLALEGLVKALPYLLPEVCMELSAQAELYTQHPKPSIKKAAQKLEKEITRKSAG